MTEAFWRGTENMNDGSRTGRILSTRVAVPHAGRP
jgi:hypothetical protein